MKIGDRIPVQIQGTDVAEAVVEDLEDGTATLIIPPTRIVVKIKAELDVAATPTPEVDRILSNEVEAKVPAPAPVDNGDIGEGIHGRELDSSAID